MKQNLSFFENEFTEIECSRCSQIVKREDVRWQLEEWDEYINVISTCKDCAKYRWPGMTEKEIIEANK